MNVLGPGPTISDVGKMKLIEFVREKESIWNPKFPEYSKPDLKCAAWQHVQAQMKSEGFDFTLSFLRKVWNNLLVYWKKNLWCNKRSSGREWSFGKSMNFLRIRYPQKKPTRVSRQRYSEDSDVNDDVEMSDEDWHAGPSADSRLIHEGDSLSNTGTDVEMDNSSNNGPLSSQKVSRPHLEAGFGADSSVHERYNKQTDQLISTSGKDRGHVNSTGDKFDKYAAFLCSVLREMPEKESKKKMQDIMFILLEL